MHFWALVLLLFVTSKGYSQSGGITVIDPGPYTPGSTIAIKLTPDNNNCLQKDNVYNLYLSDANGDFTNKKLIGTFNGFGSNGGYATFINGLIPTDAAPGSGYRLRVETTKPATISPSSPIFIITAGSAVKAAVTSAVLDPSRPEVFGTCSGHDGQTFNFTNASTTGTTVTATFYNDLTGANEGSHPLSPFYTFTANAANYTVFVKAVTTSGSVATKAYILLNNVQNTNFGTTSAGPVCLTDNGANVFYSVDLTSEATGIQRNYPGTLYTISWGDGKTDTYTFCQIVAQKGQFTHNYNASSCGQKFNGSTTNAFQISFTALNPYCSASIPINVFQAILTPPKNSISGPQNACTGTQVSFTNTSFPGQAPGSKTTNCQDPNATYSWYVDGVQQASGLKVTDKFNYTFTTHNQHTVSIKLENSASGCVPEDGSLKICVQDPPQAKFTLSSTAVCAPDNITVTDNSVIDNVCDANYTYLWTVTPATGFNFSNGNKNSKQPSFQFTAAGKYTIQLQITPPGSSCAAQTYSQTVYVNSAPQASIAPDFSLCGNNQTMVYTAAASLTQVKFSGTTQIQPDTYTWTVTPPAGAAAAQFVNGTTANSQYPAIMFPDFGTYTVSVTQKNDCGALSTATQHITFQNAPSVDAGNDAFICAGASIALSGSVSNTESVNGQPTWSGGTASGFSNVHVYNPTYTPTPAEIKAGKVELTLSVPTNLQGSCSTVSNSVTINIYPYNTVTSAASKAICSGSPLAYQITSTVPGSTYTWTATGSPTASGYTASGSGDIIEQALINSSATLNATVTYTILPHNNDCDGIPFTYTVTIVPQPKVDAKGPGVICSDQPAGIQLSSNLANTAYTWVATSSDPAHVSGYTTTTAPVKTSTIGDVLVNTGTSVATVTYVISSVNSESADNCPGNGATITVSVQPAPVTANAGLDAAVCDVASYQLNGNDLGPTSQGLWTLQSGQPGVTFDDATKYNTTVNGLQANQTYTFRWTSKGVLPCNDSFDDVTIINRQGAIKADFTIDKPVVCGTQSINFTNKSNPATGVTYAWDFGNGQTSTLQNPTAVTYTGQNNGKDSVYTVKLTITNPCSIDVKTATVTVKPTTPIVRIAPDRTTGCAPFTANIENISPGTNDSYTFYLLDASGKILSQNTRTDKDIQNFLINTPGTYQVYMIAKSLCGTATSTKYSLVVTPGNLTPRLTVNGTDATGCAPFTVTFHNNTTGGSSYTYDWGDGTNQLVTNSLGDVTHTFVKGGVYQVVLHAANGCTPDAKAAPVIIQAQFQPELNVKADVTTGCRKLTVNFSNTVTDPSSSQASDLTYDWDFGDGSPHSSAVNPVHTYDDKHSPYTVTLKATNSTGCSNILVKEDMITVNMPSFTEFAARPDSVIEIPNYHFAFTDQTANNPVSWKWDFGDGTTSTSRNPEHTYADTGLYKVTLTTANIYCDSTKSHYVRITGIPGQLYVPNAFMPNSSTPALRTFYAKGSGIKEWHLQIFNNYNQLIFDSTKLDEKGRPIDAWDGTYMGSPVPQGVYMWIISAKFINGNEWKGMSYNGSAPRRSGVIHLIR